MRALNDIWFVGDRQLTWAFPFLQQLKEEARSDREVPSVYSKFDVYTYGSDLISEIRNPLTRLHNNLIKALDERVKLPKIVVVWLDLELMNVQQTDEDVHKLVKWILTEFTRAMEGSKDALPDKAYDPQYPQSLFMKALPKYVKANQAGIIKARRRKFNRVLERCAAKFSRCHVLNVDWIYTSNLLFFNNITGQLSQTGFKAAWLQLDTLVRRLDRSDFSQERQRFTDSFYQAEYKIGGVFGNVFGETGAVFPKQHDHHYSGYRTNTRAYNRTDTRNEL